MKQVYFIAMVVLPFFISTHSFAQEHHHGDEVNVPSQSIVLIMQGMNKSLSKLSSAIMLEDYTLITLSAHNIANHPSINKEDLEILFKRLGPQKEAFIECDKAVHDLAVEIAKAGKQQNMDKVLEKYSAMMVQAAECHKKYRMQKRDFFS